MQKITSRGDPSDIIIMIESKKIKLAIDVETKEKLTKVLKVLFNKNSEALLLRTYMSLL
jgi:hypothetical protein